MNTKERLKYQIAFSFLAPSIEGQRKMNPSYQAYIETATELFEEVVGGLETITSGNGSSDWNPQQVERAQEVLALQGYDISSLSKKQIREHARYFKERVKIFKRLVKKPDAVYGKFFDRARLMNLCEDFRKFYADNHRVLGEPENLHLDNTASD